MTKETDQEQVRLLALRREGLLDSEAEPIFDGLVRVAARICRVPISLVSLVDDNRQWFKAACGLEQGTQTPREHAFCAHAIRQPEAIFEVPNTLADDRFATNPLVTGEPHIRSYAGIAIKSHDGFALGTLCVIDQVPRQLTQPQRDTLIELARVVEQAIHQRGLQQAAEKRLSDVYVETPALLYLLNAKGEITEISDLWLEHFGFSHEQVLGRNAREFMSDKAKEAFLAIRERLWEQGGCRDMPSQFITAAGVVRDVLISASIERDFLGNPVQVKCVLVDVTQQLQLQKDLEQQARIDSMTGIANRAWFFTRLKVEVDRARRHMRPLSVVMFDADRFKNINDSYGHQAGDRALVVIANQALKHGRVSDEIGRIGGEEFAMLLPETGLKGAERVAERLRAAIDELDPEDHDLPCRLTVSVGVIEFDPETSAEDTFKQVDAAMYAAKQNGRNRVALWRDDAITVHGFLLGSQEVTSALPSMREFAEGQTHSINTRSGKIRSALQKDVVSDFTI